MFTSNRNSILLLALFLPFIGFGQLGYLGKKVGVEFGLRSNYAVINSSSSFHNYKTDKDILLPKFSLGLHKENKKGTIIHWQAVYGQLPNSLVSAIDVKENVGENFARIDSVWTKSDNLQLSFGFRKYRELAPVGFYVDFRFKSNLVFNKSLFLTERQSNFTDINFFQSTRTYTTQSGFSMIPEIGFSMGTTIPLNDRVLLDVGGSLNLALGKFRDKDGDPNILPGHSDYHRIISSKKAFATNFLELYVNVILFP